MHQRVSTLSVLCSAFLLLLGARIEAVPFNVFIDTSPLSGTDGNLAFDLIDSNSAANVLTIMDFSTDGALGAAFEFGGPISGALPGTVEIQDGDFFNELLHEITFGTTISFSFELTDSFTPGGLPDSFSFFLLDADPFFPLPLFPTSDPTGADALFAGFYLSFSSIDLLGELLGRLRRPLETRRNRFFRLRRRPQYLDRILCFAGNSADIGDALHEPLRFFPRQRCMEVELLSQLLRR